MDEVSPMFEEALQTLQKNHTYLEEAIEQDKYYRATRVWPEVEVLPGKLGECEASPDEKSQRLSDIESEIKALVEETNITNEMTESRAKKLSELINEQIEIVQEMKDDW